MKILLIGNGGRENAIAWKIYNSESFKKAGGKIYTTTGNPGTDKYSEAINISSTEIKKLIEFSEKEKIEFVIVGPEIPLSMGIVDEFQEKKIKIFGPTKSAAEIESSKIFAKKLMEENNIPTGGYKNFSVNETDKAIKFISERNFPLVFKADGLAAGKGVMIANNKRESEEIIRDFSEGNTVNEAGFNFIIEEYLDGEEVSVFAICDGENFILLPFSQDHKKINDGELGKNTGGMGAVAPIRKFMTKDITEKIENKIVKPVLKAMTEAGREFRGCLFCGLMIVKGEPFVIEFNCRFGDPETQAVLPLIKSDFLEMLLKAGEKDIKNYKLETNDYNVCSIVLASEGYPDKYEVGKIISGLENVSADCQIFHSGTKYGKDINEVVTNGGRVISVAGISDKSLTEAVKIAYENADKIKFENKYNRKDIGFSQI